MNRSIEPRLSGLAMLTVLAVGSYLRLDFYLSDRAIWNDEAMMALDAIEGGFQKLFFGGGIKVAPPGFLLVETSIAKVLGNSAEALRIYPLLGGLGALVLFGVHCRRYYPAVMQVLGLMLFALSSELILYSAELKAYSTDVFFALVLLYMGFRRVDDFHAKRLIRFTVLGSLIAWFSFPAGMVFAAVASVIFLETWPQKRNPSLRVWSLAGVLFLANLVAIYLVAIEPRTTHSLTNFWSGYHLRTDLTWSGAFYNYYLLSYTIYHQFGIAGFPFTLNSFIAIWFVGIVWGVARRDRYVLVSALVFLFAVVASAMKLNPLHYRVVLYLVPFFIIGFLSGVMLVLKLVDKVVPKRGVAIVAQVALCLWIGYVMVVRVEHEYFADPMPIAAYGEDFRPFFRQLKKQVAPGEPIFVDYSSRHVYSYNSHRFDFHAPSQLIPKIKPWSETAVQAYVEAQLPRGRSWWIFSGREEPNHRVRDAYLRALRSTGGRVTVLQSNEGILVEFDPV